MGSYLLQCLVIDEAGSVFGEIKLPALNLLSELPAGGQFPFEAELQGAAAHIFANSQVERVGLSRWDMGSCRDELAGFTVSRESRGHETQERGESRTLSGIPRREGGARLRNGVGNDDGGTDAVSPGV